MCFIPYSLSHHQCKFFFYNQKRRSKPQPLEEHSQPSPPGTIQKVSTLQRPCAISKSGGKSKKKKFKKHSQTIEVKKIEPISRDHPVPVQPIAIKPVQGQPVPAQPIPGHPIPRQLSVTQSNAAQLSNRYLELCPTDMPQHDSIHESEAGFGSPSYFAKRCVNCKRLERNLPHLHPQIKDTQVTTNKQLVIILLFLFLPLSSVAVICPMLLMFCIIYFSCHQLLGEQFFHSRFL